MSEAYQEEPMSGVMEEPLTGVDDGARSKWPKFVAIYFVVHAALLLLGTLGLIISGEVLSSLLNVIFVGLYLFVAKNLYARLGWARIAAVVLLVLHTIAQAGAAISALYFFVFFGFSWMFIGIFIVMAGLAWLCIKFLIELNRASVKAEFS